MLDGRKNFPAGQNSFRPLPDCRGRDYVRCKFIITRKRHLWIARFASPLERRGKQWAVSSVPGDDTAAKPIDLPDTCVLPMFNVLNVGGLDVTGRQMWYEPHESTPECSGAEGQVPTSFWTVCNDKVFNVRS